MRNVIFVRARSEEAIHKIVTAADARYGFKDMSYKADQVVEMCCPNHLLMINLSLNGRECFDFIREGAVRPAIQQKKYPDLILDPVDDFELIMRAIKHEDYTQALPPSLITSSVTGLPVEAPSFSLQVTITPKG